ncbi:glycosyltransferase [Aeromicrobium wangtongii]|uniref:Glycosyltransferase n=1 Tax=Aeromicrobium wangtongii TaxID=2969247 RepID=A0ABY5MHV2_9ACTN|nr:glycosyltransferase [Aeromicrobium wangtongii]MCD9196888.1 glycosyltransferase [Aeromicrobium wangtongii]UUP15476.1 glycosyltransferase [Aeromicrobium wangtongii]
MSTRRQAIVYCAGAPWDAVQGTDRHLVRSLARHVDVLWVDPPLSSLRIAAGREPRGAVAGGRLRDVDDRTTRLLTIGPPFPGRRTVLPITQGIMRRSIRRAVQEAGMEVLATIVASPLQPLRVVPGGAQVYFATDDFVAGAELMGQSRSLLAREEQRRLDEADLLMAVSPTIAGPWQGRSAATMVLPNGCDASAYDRLDQAPEVTDVPLVPPIAGVVGQLSPRLDLSLIEAVADSGISVLLVGPVQPGFEPERFARLAARPNVAWVGRKELSELRSYLRLMDVGLTPYADSDFNRASFPLKTLEYLAAGMPVVSTPLPAVEWLGTSLIAVAEEPLDFARAVKQAVTDAASPHTAERARSFAGQHTWDARAADLLQAIDRLADR